MRSKILTLLLTLCGIFLPTYLQAQCPDTPWGPFLNECSIFQATSVFRFCSTDGHHLYTNDLNEAKSLYYAYCMESSGNPNFSPCPAPGNWVYEGLGWPNLGAGLYTGIVYRLSKGANHLYTMSSSELTNAQNLGWTYEGNAGYLYNNGSTPVYRLRNLGTGDYFYTTSLTERNFAASHGYVSETDLGYLNLFM